MEEEEICGNTLLYTSLGAITTANDISIINDLDIQILLEKYKTVKALQNADRDNLSNGIIKHLLQQNYNRT